MELTTVLIITGLVTLTLAHYLVMTRLAMLEARSALRGTLQRRFDLIKNMFKIVQTHVPEYGAMLELLITMRLERSKSLDDKTCIEMNQEVFQMLFELINVSGYVSENDTHLRNEFKARHAQVEKDLQAARNYYETCLSAYNRTFYIRSSESMVIPEIRIPSEENKKAVLRLLDSMVG